MDSEGRRRPRRWLRRMLIATATALGAVVVLFALLWVCFPFDLRKVRGFPASMRIKDRSGELLRVIPSARGEMCLPVPLSEMSPWLPLATVAVEDRRFHQHPGVDLLAAARALLQNISRLEIHSGASTLTMQIVRIVEQRPRTVAAKAIEAFHALQITAWMSKDETLAAYLNLAPYGGNLRGAEAAALRYFGKRARDLDLSEAALIAGLPQSPSRLRPDRHPERALARRKVVLDAMLREGFIDAEQHRDASARGIDARLRPWPFRAPHIAEIARRGAAPPEDVALEGPPPLRTTLDAGAQSVAESALREFFAAAPWARRGLGGAVVVIEVETAAVRALVGSPDFFDADRDGQVCCATARRSPGSTLKPLLYALAFDAGAAGPSVCLADVPTPYRAYIPENFDREHRGPVPADEALRSSLNVPAVRLLERVGTERFLEHLRALGVAGPRDRAERYGLTLVLGGGEVRLLDLAGAYAVFPRRGAHRPARLLEAQPAAAPRQVISPGAAHLIFEALADRRHIARCGHLASPGRAGRIACKTGTSFGHRDAWAVAFDARRVVGVWIGDPRGKPHPDLVGVRAAAPVALRILDELARGEAPEDIEPPSDIVEMTVCSRSGLPAGPHCPSTRRALFAAAGAERLPLCSVHRAITVDADEGWELCRRCAEGRRTAVRVVEEWPPEVALWLRLRGAADERPPHLPSCPRSPAASRGPRILSPVDGSRYRFLSDVPFAQKLLLSAAAAPGVERVHWFVDGEHLAAEDPDAAISWTLAPGAHEIRCVDDRGRAAASRIEVEADAPSVARTSLPR